MKSVVRYALYYLGHFVLCMSVFLALFSILLIYHSPFVNLRDYIVSMSMATSENKIWSTMFLSQNEINSILANTGTRINNGTEDVKNVKVQVQGGGSSQNSNEATAFSSSSQSSIPSNTKISVMDITEPDFKAKLMVVDDPSKVTVGLAPKIGETGATVRDIVKANNALAGINGGGFIDDSFVGAGAHPDGVIVQNGQIQFQRKGVNSFNVIGFNQDNVLVISNSMTIDQIKSSHLRCAISFGPALILNGTPLVSSPSKYLEPRSAIAQRKDGVVLLLAIDGRQAGSMGADYKDEQDLLLKYGAYNAANLDGGSSTTLYYRDKIINNPCDIMGERLVPTAFIVK